MWILRKVFLSAILLFFFFTSPSTADITFVKFRSHNRDTILFSEFEFSHTGYVSVAVSSVAISSLSVTSNLTDPSRIGFFLLSNELLDRYELEFKRNRDLCALDIKFISVLFTLQDLSPTPQSSFNKSYHVTYPGLYSLYFANCNELCLVTMDARTELYNVNTDVDGGTRKDYLSAAQRRPSFYFIFFLIYLCFLALWIFVCFKNRQHFQKIHLLMGVLLVITFLYFICAAADQHYLNVRGTPHHSWRVLFYIYQFMRTVLFYTVIVLIGAGWCFWKPFLLRWEKLVLTIVIILQIWANKNSIMVKESGPYNQDWIYWEHWFGVEEGICCMVITIQTIISALLFQEKYWTWFNWFRYIYVRPLLFSILVSLPPSILVLNRYYEIFNLVFSLVMFCMYQPFALDDEEKCAVFFDHTGV